MTNKELTLTWGAFTIIWALDSVWWSYPGNLIALVMTCVCFTVACINGVLWVKRGKNDRQ